MASTSQDVIEPFEVSPGEFLGDTTLKSHSNIVVDSFLAVDESLQSTCESSLSSFAGDDACFACDDDFSTSNDGRC